MKDDASREYTGARGARFAIFPGSGLFKKPPSWAMVAELVETTRLWGRVAARIDPADVEPLAGHLVKRTYSEPRWDPRQGSVVATERVTLYGLPIVTDRKVQYGRIDPVLSRELFIRRALVEGEWESRHAFVAENRRLIEEVEALEHRARRRDILADDQALFEFFDERVPEDVVSAAGFDRWWRDQPPDLLTYTRDVLVRSPDAVDEQTWPSTWRQGELTLDLDYRFEPGAPDDGMTRGRAACSCSAPCGRTASSGSSRGCARSSSRRSSEDCRRTCGGGWCRCRRQPRARWSGSNRGAGHWPRISRGRSTPSPSRPRRGTSRRSRRTCG